MDAARRAAAFSTSSMPRDTATNCLPPFAVWAWRASFQRRSTSPYRSGPSKTWIKVKKSEGASCNPRHGWDVLADMSFDRVNCE